MGYSEYTRRRRLYYRMFLRGTLSKTAFFELSLDRLTDEPLPIVLEDIPSSMHTDFRCFLNEAVKSDYHSEIGISAKALKSAVHWLQEVELPLEVINRSAVDIFINPPRFPELKR